MPKNPNFENGLIYKIVCNDYTITNTYVGSTCDLTKRKHSHKKNCNNENDRHYRHYVYQFIRSHGGWENWSMIKVIDFPCTKKYELETEERRQMTLLQADLNKVVPTRTEKEYWAENKDKKAKKDKTYREKHSEEIKQQKNEKFTCECGGCYSRCHKTEHERSKKHLKFIKSKQTEIIL